MIRCFYNVDASFFLIKYLLDKLGYSSNAITDYNIAKTFNVHSVVVVKNVFSSEFLIL